MIKLVTILLFIVCSSTVHLQAQEKLTDPGPHQIFFEKPIDKIKTFEYKDSGEKIPFELNPEKDTILIPNYNGKSRVLIEYYDQSGKLIRVVKSNCYIDPQITT